jgi:peptidoglycan/LPS O-acetylase OafA/YrhL
MVNTSLPIERLNLIRFPLIVGVVFIHSYISAFDTMGVAAHFVLNFFSNGLASVAVPAFFLISGFLFFYQFEWSGKSFLKKLKSRFRTILLPYIFWNLTAMIFMLILFNTFNPHTSQFWYINELMALILLTPVFHLMHKKIPVMFLVVFLVVWLFFDWSNTTIPVMSSMLPVLFFYAGSVIAVKKSTPFLFDKYGIAMSIICLLIFAIDAIYKPSGLLLHKVGILAGVIAALYLTKILLNEKIKPIVLWLGKASFFIFAIHQPYLGVALAGINRWIPPTSDTGKMLLYFAAPIITIVVAILIFKWLIRISPGFLAFITGGRSSDLVAMNHRLGLQRSS